MAAAAAVAAAESPPATRRDVGRGGQADNAEASGRPAEDGCALPRSGANGTNANVAALIAKTPPPAQTPPARTEGANSAATTSAPNRTSRGGSVYNGFEDNDRGGMDSRGAGEGEGAGAGGAGIGAVSYSRNDRKVSVYLGFDEGSDDGGGGALSDNESCCSYDINNDGSSPLLPPVDQSLQSDPYAAVVVEGDNDGATAAGAVSPPRGAVDCAYPSPSRSSGSGDQAALQSHSYAVLLQGDAGSRNNDARQNAISNSTGQESNSTGEIDLEMYRKWHI